MTRSNARVENHELNQFFSRNNSLLGRFFIIKMARREGFGKTMKQFNSFEQRVDE